MDLCKLLYCYCTENSHLLQMDFGKIYTRKSIVGNAAPMDKVVFFFQFCNYEYGSCLF